MMLLLKNLLFTLVAPGTVAVLLPLLLARGESPPVAIAKAIALPLFALGGAIYVWCVWDFASFGRGTPAPIDAPKKLVLRGLYRYVRNPMYLGVLTVVLAWAVLFQSLWLAAYAALVATCFHLFVLFYEEPHLARAFGDEYAAYRAAVGRWIYMPRVEEIPGMPAMTSRERGVLAATCVSSLGSFYTMAVTGFAMPQIQRGLAIPEDELGSLFALLRFGTLFSLVLAVAADRLGRRRLLIASVAGCAICNIATAFAQNGLALAWMQMGSRFFFGAQVLLATVVVTEELSSDNRGWGLGVLAAVGGMGGALTVFAYMLVDYLPFGWRSLYVLGGMGLLTVPWLWRSLQETRRFSDQQSQADGSAPSGSPWQPLQDIARLHTWRLVALTAMVVPVMVILEPASIFISKHLQDDLGYSPAQVGIFMGLCGIATPFGNVLSGSISDRFGRRPVTALMSLVLSGAVALFYNATGLFGLGLGLALLFLSIGSLVVLHGALAAELFPTALRSTAAGMREALGTIGASLGLGMVSLLYALTGSHPTSITWILLVTPLSPLVILFFVPETARRELEEIAPDDVGT